MKSYKSIFRGLYLMICIIGMLSSCKTNSPEGNGNNINHELAAAITKYVTCPTDSVEMMLAASVSIIQLVDTCSLEYLNLDNEEVNNSSFAS